MDQLVRKTREVRPRHILTYGPRDAFNPDHESVSKFVFDASVLSTSNGVRLEGTKTAKQASVFGFEPHQSERVPEHVEDEVANLFHYMREIMELTGGTTDDISHLSVSLTDREYKKIVNVEWLKMFPDENNRPARHSTLTDLRDGLREQIEMTAVL